jgi:RHS repeat-associated protein
VGLPVGQTGDHGALVRTESLVFDDAALDLLYADAGGSRRPQYLGGSAALPAGAPSVSAAACGYRKVSAGPEGHVDGWYTDLQRQAFDVQTGSARPRGLVTAMRDALGNDTQIAYDAHDLLPTTVTDAAGLRTSASYNYRVLQPARRTDANGAITLVLYNPIGLPLTMILRGLDSQDQETLGGTAAKPETRFVYNFRNFERTGQSIFVHVERRLRHASDNASDEVIETRQYSDGYGRLVQTRIRAQQWVAADNGDAVGLPADQDAALGDAVVRKVADNVIVSGWQVYDNKGQLIEKYEPFFSTGFAFEDDARRGERAMMFYDPRGNLLRTIRADGSQQRMVLGRPMDPRRLALSAADLASADVPTGFEPTPWESYSYDSNDLAPVSFGPSGADLRDRVPPEHHFTPASTVIDAMGRTLCQVVRNGAVPATDWHITRSDYDVRGNLTTVRDAHGRIAFSQTYDLLDRTLRVDAIDAGLRTSVLDARGSLIEYRDSRGSLAVRVFDALNRLKELWARDDSAGAVTLRERILYGDDGDRVSGRRNNSLGRIVKHYDEAGLLEVPDYDFKGNPLERARTTISDAALAAGWQAAWEQPDADAALDAATYRTNTRYDALNRPIEAILPRDAGGQRRTLTPRFDQAGALEALALDGTDYVQQVIYNPKGQRLLVVYGNGVMTRHCYDPETFRLARLRSERCNATSNPAGVTRSWAGVGQPLQDFAYDYDLAGNLTAIDERVPGCGVVNSPLGRDRMVRRFLYDPVYRLVSATGRACKTIGAPRGLDDDPRCGFYDGSAAATQDNAPDLTETYTERYDYDPAGNMRGLAYQANSGSWTRTFAMGGVPPASWQAAPNNQLTGLENGTVTHQYGFDRNGNLARQNADREHVWDHADRMISYRVRPNPNAPASLEARYLYGADGQRVKKWVRNQQGRINTTVYVGNAFEHHRQTDSTGTRENNDLHLIDNGRRIAVVRIGAALDPAAGAVPPILYHLGDHLGGSNVVIGGDDAASNAFINREEYLPYGETSFGGFARKRYRHSGRERDSESGLYQMGARYYAPWLQRWASCDPSGPRDGPNLYQAFKCSPLVYGDASGLASDNPGGGDDDLPQNWFRNAQVTDRDLDVSKQLTEVQQAGREAVHEADVLRQDWTALRTEMRDMRDIEMGGVFEVDWGAQQERVRARVDAIAQQQERLRLATAKYESKLATAGELRGRFPELSEHIDAQLAAHTGPIRDQLNVILEQIRSLEQEVRELGVQSGSAAKALGIIGVYAIGAAKLIGKVFTFYGAHTQAKESYEAGHGDSSFYLLTFTACVAAGAVDDAMAASEVAAPLVMDSWDTEDAGPTQVFVGNKLREGYEWYQKNIGL